MTYLRAAIVSTAVCVLAAGCSKSIEETPEYQAACHGAPLRTDEEFNQAMDADYEINRQFDCIDKKSFARVAEATAKWNAANTPAAIAAREAEYAVQRERAAAEREQRREEETRAAAEPLTIELRNVDANTATEAEIANVVSVGPDVAAQVVRERTLRPFANWSDLVGRVVGLSAAQTAVRASLCGLNVNGRSLDGAPPGSGCRE